MNADRIKIECDEDGFHLIIDGDSPCEGYTASIVDYRITDPEAFYDHVKAAIGPWLYEREQARTEALREPKTVLDSGPYDMSSTKHPRYHSTHADLWDAREGK